MYNSDNSLHKPGLQLVPTAYQVLEAATEGVLYKKVFLTISQNSQENLCRSLFLNKVAGL